MRINGEWYRCDDEVIRPVIRADVLVPNGSWRRTEFLLDIGADRTVLTAAALSVTEFESLDMCVLGRDITRHFAVIYSGLTRQPGTAVFSPARSPRADHLALLFPSPADFCAASLLRTFFGSFFTSSSQPLQQRNTGSPWTITLYGTPIEPSGPSLMGQTP